MERRFPRLDTMSYAREIRANLAPASESMSCWTSLRRRRFSHQRYEERVREWERAYWSHAVSDRVRVNISSDMQGPPAMCRDKNRERRIASWYIDGNPRSSCACQYTLTAQGMAWRHWGWCVVRCNLHIQCYISCTSQHAKRN